MSKSLSRLRQTAQAATHWAHLHQLGLPHKLQLVVQVLQVAQPLLVHSALHNPVDERARDDDVVDEVCQTPLQEPNICCLVCADVISTQQPTVQLSRQDACAASGAGS